MQNRNQVAHVVAMRMRDKDLVEFNRVEVEVKQRLQTAPAAIKK